MFSHIPPWRLFDIQLANVTFYCTFGVRLRFARRDRLLVHGSRTRDRAELIGETAPSRPQRCGSRSMRYSLYKDISHDPHMVTLPHMTRIWCFVTANVLFSAQRLLLFPHT
jgi:hypothetical protein